MRQGLICAEGELSIAVNTIERYVEFMINAIEEYSKIVSEITESKIIQDELITAELESLVGKVSAEKNSLDKVMNNIRSIVSQEIVEIEAADCFDYPELSWNDVKSLLASFF